jgi:hypothetical protein
LNGIITTLKVILLIIIKRQDMKRLNNIHPGEILQEEFLIPLNISAYKLAKDIHIPQTRISQIIKSKEALLQILQYV